MKTGGIVLCGGRSSRMGRPKAWLPFGDELLLQRVVRIVGSVVDPVVVVAAPGQEVPPLPDAVEIVRDEVEGRGPLHGLASGLAALQGRVDAAYLSACDVPFLKPEFVSRVIALLGSHSIAVPQVGGRHHPLAAAYCTTALPEIRALLAANRLRMGGLFEVVPTRLIEAQELGDVDSLRNLNAPEEYEAALSELAGRSR